MYKFFRKFLRIIFPNYCISCDCIIDHEAIFCANCYLKLEFISDPKCKICSYPFETNFEENHKNKSGNLTCTSCLLKHPSFDKVITVFRYNQIIKKIVKDFKYHDQIFIAKKIAKLLKAKLAPELENTDIITIVPLHRQKLKFRKFNQAAMIANNLLDKKTKKEKLIFDILFRAKNTPQQTSLRFKQRKKNVKNAFIVNRKYRDFIKDKRIIIIDDVMTTGSTLESCAKTLKKFKAKEVIVLTIAKTVFSQKQFDD